jgi:Glycosyl hydrolase family 115/Gylcosyl hydrolase family 115 C-terminal domain
MSCPSPADPTSAPPTRVHRVHPGRPAGGASRRLLLMVVAGATALPAFASTAAAAPSGSATDVGSAVSTTAGGVRPTDPGSYVRTHPGPGYFPLVEKRRAATIVVGSDDYAGVVRVVGDLQGDLKAVTGVEPEVAYDTVPAGDAVVIVGTVGHSRLIDALVARGKLNVSAIRGRWETSLQQVVTNPVEGVARALVIAGSDQRGTIYGAYDVSRGIGVSPWHFWDDVTPVHRDALYVTPGAHTQGTPAVRYRGFFINDENPSTGRWAPRFFGPGKAEGYPGGLNAAYFSQVFETMLRLKANYLWPAVWGRAFAEDDPANHATATKYGVVMGTSHEAPMMRGIEEWNRHAVAAVRDSAGTITTPGHDPYGGTGEWSFRRNRAAIEAYWREGIQRMVDQGYDGVVTLGMRGNGDVGLPDGDGIELMQEIIATQRAILVEVTGKPITEIPQVWTLYKEVQRYWDQGLRAPDDVIVNFTDDNWSNLRKLPAQDEKRSGGYGLYYHFDYVGGGRNYKWVDTTNLANVWDQLHQAYSYGDRSLWVANVGDLKNSELPAQFFVDYAWNPSRWSLDQLNEWETAYAASNFGTTHAAEIAAVLSEYGRLQSRRKPELLNRRITLDPAKDVSTDSGAVVYDDQGTPFSLTAYREMDRVTAQWQALAARVERLRAVLPADQQAAFYQLVYYPAKATANLYALRDAEFTNLLYARQGRALTDDLADVAQARFADDQAMSAYYNDELSGGKWKDWQTQPHIDYGDVARYGPNAPWQQPELNNEALPDVIFPALQRITLPDAAALGVAVDGSEKAWPGTDSDPVLPRFSPYQTAPKQYIDVFNRGKEPFAFTVRPGASWLHVDRPAGRVDKQVRVTLTVDWTRAPTGTTSVPVTVTGPAGSSVVVTAPVEKPTVTPAGFVEAGGVISIQADHFSAAVAAGGVSFRRIPGIGRTGAGMEPFPVTAPRQEVGAGPRLEYTVTATTGGPADVTAFLSPRNNTFPTDGLKYAISVDDGEPQVVNITTATGANDTTMNKQWERNTSDNTNRTTTRFDLTKGTHTVTFWMIDPTVVLQNLVIDAGGLQPSYLGPPESRRFPS